MIYIHKIVIGVPCPSEQGHVFARQAELKQEGGMRFGSQVRVTSSKECLERVWEVFLKVEAIQDDLVVPIGTR